MATVAATEQNKSRRCPSTSGGTLRNTSYFLGFRGWKLLQKVMYLLLFTACSGTGWVLKFIRKSGISLSYSAVWQHTENPTVGHRLFSVSMSLLTTLSQISLLSDADWHLLLERAAFIWESHQILEWFICYFRLAIQFSFKSNQTVAIAMKNRKAGRVRGRTPSNLNQAWSYILLHYIAEEKGRFYFQIFRYSKQYSAVATQFYTKQELVLQ